GPRILRSFYSFAGRPRVISVIATETDMPQLIVRRIEEKVVRKLKQRAGQHGVSMEEEHRRILREALLGKRGQSFKEALLAMPNVGRDEDFERGIQIDRSVEL